MDDEVGRRFGDLPPKMASDLWIRTDALTKDAVQAAMDVRKATIEQLSSKLGPRARGGKEGSSWLDDFQGTELRELMEWMQKTLNKSRFLPWRLKRMACATP